MYVGLFRTILHSAVSYYTLNISCLSLPSHKHCIPLKLLIFTKFSISDVHQIRFVPNSIDPPGGTVQCVRFYFLIFTLFLFTSL